MSARKLLFLITEDWFFASHFLPLARRAREDGYEVIVAARSSGALADVEGVRVVDMPFARRSLRPWDVGRQIVRLRALIDAEHPDIVHAIALKPIALLLLARVRGIRQVLAVTGRGYVSTGKSPWTKVVAWRLQRMVRRGLDKPNTVLLVENEADRAWIEGRRSLPSRRVVLMPGAGVDAAAFQPAPEPTLDAGSPIVVGVVARLIRSKGVDLAVEAVRRLRKRGLDIVLRVAGAPDQENPDHVGAREVGRWKATPGVELLGRIENVSAFWARAHIACLPSRGGEGLPRSLLEAAACGRPIVTSDTPGCQDFVSDGEIGLVFTSGDVEALGSALRSLAVSAEARCRMGLAARSRVLAGYTEAHAARCAAQAWGTAGSLQEWA